MPQNMEKMSQYNLPKILGCLFFTELFQKHTHTHTHTHMHSVIEIKRVDYKWRILDHT